MNNFLSNQLSIERVIEIGLIYWIKSKCQSIDEIELKIIGLKLNPFGSEVEKLIIKGKNINFRNLPIQELKLETNKIKLALNIMNKKTDLVTIKNEFNISGQLSATQKQLNQIFISEEWGWLGDWITQTFFDDEKFSELYINNNLFRVKAFNESRSQSKEKILILKSIRGKAILQEKESSQGKEFPMDKSIYIKQLFIKDSKLYIDIISKVIP
ncbi:MULTISPECIES: hypothetical protein [Prochlorococcus]|uniref:DUF2993 domain-containing protein n=1 Tax=Prochlorococcus marinus (strain SARG / CCMP1375 / SS120) TaxID=167539 RepID=Q7VBI2_PROMA|nr:MULTISPECIES: hypothetical protein [Prochlorococcus]AAQ00155.1 Uncharacterized protein Pro_1110 [Prochlorococcus marinus subsp. marinus str. CCMP1375]KGG13951.1 hypothetical protein EV04_0436 [Prochlorococcus marinus str. LG]KGG23376.1 hypothetical protein EV09_1000 [Prochlorococcus marinus str. SS35]KGG32388.1 hypothetical protein EV10_1503 [Prochlorococcus marinus str. SS51]